MGKTRIASEIIARTKGRSLFVAHRDELITQAQTSIARDSGLQVELEKASLRAKLGGTSVVVASIQTLKSSRLKRWNPNEFATIVVDEAHRTVAKTYQHVLDYFSGAKVLCITATPDRSDKASLRAVVDHVSYAVEMQDAITDGWLCPIRVRQVNIEDMDLTNVRTLKGDLSDQDLEQMLGSDQLLHLIAKPIADLSGDRPTLIFTPGVQSAHQLACILSSYVGGHKVASLDGNTAKDDRKRIIGDYLGGKIQYLVNCQLLTEGFDAPHTSCVVMARPTKSRALYAQAIGRGTRIAPGKTDCLVLDMKGSAGKHRLINPVDILGGKMPGEVQAAVVSAIMRGETLDVLEALKAERERLASERLKRQEQDQTNYKLLADVRYTTREIDPFAVIGEMVGRVIFTDDQHNQASEKQLQYLARMNIPTNVRMTKKSASNVIDKFIERRKAGLCTYKQAATLAKWGMQANVPFPEANAIITRAKNNGWQVTRDDYTKYRRQD